MRTKRKILSLLLCGVMLFSVCSPVAYAEERTEQTGQEQMNDSGAVREEGPDRRVQEMIDALPAPDKLQTMSREEQNKVYADLQAAYDAYEALTGEQKETITGAEVFESLFAFFNGMVNLLDTQVSIADGPVTITDAGGPSCPGHIITGTSDTNTITVTGGTHNITLQGVNIDVGASGIGAFSIASGATVELTLEGTNTLKSSFSRAGLEVPSGATLVITQASDGSSLSATSTYGAGIGGGNGGAGGTITINGGTVNAESDTGAGIGGGQSSDGGTITISGGNVTATSDRGGAGIGGGEGGAGGTITISGNAEVIATSKGYGAGIGGGSDGDGGNITISGGDVTATGNRYGAGIGGGEGGAGGTITISGGTVDASSYGGAGIGGGYGYGSAGGEITISGGTVTATSDRGAGIGGGKNGGNGTFVTGTDGNAFIVADSISDKTKVNSWSGVIFEGNAGQVYNSPVKLTTDAEVPIGKELTIQNGQTLTIGDGVTLKNAGTITNNGTLTVEPGGRLEGEVTGGTVNYAVIVQTEGNGTASASLTSAEQGTEITLTAKADSGWHFKGWQVVSGSAVISGDKFTMPAENVTVKAIFEKDSYTIMVQTEGNGSASASLTSAEQGTEITLTAKADSGWHFKGWQVVSGNAMISGGKFTMPAENVTVKAIFEKDSYTIMVQTEGNGTASASPTSAEQGTEITLTATPDKDWHFKEWQVVSGSAMISGNKFTMPAENITVKAIFEKDKPEEPEEPEKPEEPDKPEKPSKPDNDNSDRDNSSPTHGKETLTSGGVTLTGDRVHEYARLTVIKDRLHSTCTGCDQLRRWQQQGRVIAVYDVSLSYGFRGSVTLTFPVPAAYEGKTLTVAHCRKDTLETHSVTVSGGKVTVTVDSLSPFAILDTAKVEVNPDTGAPSGVAASEVPQTPDISGAIVLCVLAVMLAAAALYKRRNGNS